MRPTRYLGASYQAKCSVLGCTDTIRVVKHGLCVTHYSRFITKGTLEKLVASATCQWCKRGMTLGGSDTTNRKYCSKSCQSAAKRSRLDQSPEARHYRCNAKFRYKLKAYGITPAEYDALVKKQNGKCAICSASYGEQIGGLCVDHCHKTSRVRGLLCRRCNAALGGFQDNLELLQKAIDYLREVVA